MAAEPLRLGKRGSAARLLLPAGVEASALPLLVARALRALADGYMAVLLPAYLLSIGLGTLEVGIVATTTMLGSAMVRSRCAYPPKGGSGM